MVEVTASVQRGGKMRLVGEHMKECRSEAFSHCVLVQYVASFRCHKQTQEHTLILNSRQCGTRPTSSGDVDKKEKQRGKEGERPELTPDSLTLCFSPDVWTPPPHICVPPDRLDRLNSSVLTRQSTVRWHLRFISSGWTEEKHLLLGILLITSGEEQPASSSAL